jgi:hypothetical protein
VINICFSSDGLLPLLPLPPPTQLHPLCLSVSVRLSARFDLPFLSLFIAVIAKFSHQGLSHFVARLSLASHSPFSSPSEDRGIGSTLSLRLSPTLFPALCSQFHLFAAGSCLEVATQQQNLVEQCRIIGDLAGVYLELDDPRASLRHAERHLAAAQAIGNQAEQARAHGVAGTARYALGDYAAAAAAYRRELALAERCGDVGGQAKAWLGIALCVLRGGGGSASSVTTTGGEAAAAAEAAEAAAATEAEAALLRAGELADRARLAELQVKVRLNLARAALRRGNVEDGVGLLAAAVRECERMQLGLGDAARVDLLDAQRGAYADLQLALLAAGRREDALAAAERAKARALRVLLKKHAATVGRGDVTGVVPPPAETEEEVELDWGRVQQLAAGEGAWVVVFSFLNDERLVAWSLNPSGALVGCRRIDMGRALEPFGGRLAALMDAVRCAVIRRGGGGRRDGGAPAREAGEGEQAAVEMEEEDQDKARVLASLKLFEAPPASGSPDWHPDARAAASAEAEAAAREEAAAAAVDPMAGRCPALQELETEGRRESAGVAAWLRWLSADAAASAAEAVAQTAAANMVSLPGADTVPCGKVDPAAAAGAAAAAADYALKMERAVCEVRRRAAGRRARRAADGGGGAGSIAQAAEAGDSDTPPEDDCHALLRWASLRRAAEGALAAAADAPAAAAAARVLAAVRGLMDPAAMLRRLYDLLLAPLAEAEELPPMGAPLLIVPDLDLFGVPWAALEGPDGRPLVHRYPLRLTPSLAVSAAARFRADMSPPPPPPPAGLLLVGDPWPVGADGFPPLEGAESEANMVAELVGGQALLSAHATRAEVERRMHGARLVHLACHGWLQRRALLLAKTENDDGLLTAEGIQERVALGAGSTVVLSACHSARGRVAAEGIVGLARALLAAGAGAAVVSQWAVPDRRTRLLMEPFYYAFSRGCAASAALRFAMVLAARAVSADPCGWAGFVVVGADTRMPRAPGPGAWSRWTVEEVARWLGRCGLQELVEVFRKNDVGGDYLALWARQGAVGAKCALRDDLGVNRLALRDGFWEQLSALAAAGAAAAAAPPPPDAGTVSLGELEAGFRHERSKWFEMAGLGAHMRCGPDREEEGGYAASDNWSSKSQSESELEGSDGEVDRNWSLNLYRKNSCEPNLAAWAGKCEKEALRALGVPLMLDGQEIGADDSHGFLGQSKKGFLSPEALAVLGLAEGQTYADLWGAYGRAVEAARGLTAAPLQEAALKLREAADFRLRDIGEACTLWREVRAAVAKAIRAHPEVKTRRVTILSLYSLHKRHTFDGTCGVAGQRWAGGEWANGEESGQGGWGCGAGMEVAVHLDEETACRAVLDRMQAAVYSERLTADLEVSVRLSRLNSKQIPALYSMLRLVRGAISERGAIRVSRQGLRLLRSCAGCAIGACTIVRDHAISSRQIEAPSLTAHAT